MPMRAAYVRAAVEAAGLKLSLLEDRSARNEDNVPVPGLVVGRRENLSLDATTSRRNGGIACGMRRNFAIADAARNVDQCAHPGRNNNEQ